MKLPSGKRRRSPIKRGKPPRKVNTARKAKEFARCYHSKERVQFIKSLPCVVCWPSVYRLGACMTCSPPTSDNAHSVGDGAGRKAGYQTIVPLCRDHHIRYDQHREPFDIEEGREAIQANAPIIEHLWQSHRGPPETEPE